MQKFDLPIARFLLRILAVIQVGKHSSQLRETQIDYKKTSSTHPNTLIKWGKNIDCLAIEILFKIHKMCDIVT